jgi:glycerol-3-phosphate dehydrogenase (NAD(P)+)
VARFAVIGATSWGVTLSWLLLRGGHAVILVTRNEAESAAVSARGGIERLPGTVLTGAFGVTELSHFQPTCDGIIVAVPAQSMRTTLRAGALGEAPVLSAAKGIELGTGLRMSELVRTFTEAPIAALSGPNLSHEVVAGLPAAAVVASADSAATVLWRDALSTGAFRAYTSDDIAGVELAGALKNIVAIAAGAAWGLDFGANAVATIMTRGLAEMTRLGVALGAQAPTFQGLAGVGDLAATCYSPLSRNRRLGELLSHGTAPSEALHQIGETVEGAATARIAVELGLRLGLDLPIATEVVAVLDGRRSVPEAMSNLLARPLGPELAPFR